MASVNVWLGRQQATVQVGSFTVTADDATTTYKITCGGVVVSVLGTGSGPTATATALTAALAACTAGMFQEITWTSLGAVITATANTAGTPFVATSSVSGGAGTLGAYTAVTANTSPSDINDAVNWSAGAVPGAGDHVWIDGTVQVPLLWNLGALSAVAVSDIHVAAAFTKQIGLTSINANGTPYTEYRAISFAIQFSTLAIGYGPGSGSGLMKFDPGSATASTVTVYTTAGPTETGSQGALWLLGTNAGNALVIYSGSVAVCPVGGTVATYATINIGPAAGSTPSIYLGAGLTCTTITNNGGTMTLQSAVTTLNLAGGTTNVLGAGALGTINCSAGVLYVQSTGTITNFNVTGASVDMGDSGPPITVTHLTLGPNTAFSDGTFRGTYTNGVVLTALARLTGGVGGNVSLDFGPGRTLTPS